MPTLVSYIVFLFLCMCPLSLQAHDRDLKAAADIARRYWRVASTKQAMGVPSSWKCQFYENQSCIAVFRRALGGQVLPGFVLVPKDPGLPEIIAYASDARFAEDSLPPNITAWLHGYGYMAEIYHQNPIIIKNWLKVFEAQEDSIAPLLGNITWGQGHPYNMLCPEIRGNKAPTGCVATALSQIMRFHRWPLSGTGDVSYKISTIYEPITFDFRKTEFEWDYMLDSYNRLYNQRESNAVSTLMAAAGAAVKMNYNVNGSGASNIEVIHGMREYLCYDYNMFLASSESFSAAQWHLMLREELLAGRPVYYTGGAFGGGHAFVIDGMEVGEDGLTRYHVNWGWDGLCNGYYLLNMLCPAEVGTGGTTGTNYAVGAEMIVGMMPEDCSPSSSKMACKELLLSEDSVFTGQSVSGLIRSLVYLNGADFHGDIKIVLRNPADSLFVPIPIYEESGRTISSTRVIANYKFSCVIPEKVPAGVYEVALECLSEDGTIPKFLKEDWPRITVLPTESWLGGNRTQPKQVIAFRGVSAECSDEEKLCFRVFADSLINISNSGAYGELALLLCDLRGRLISTMNSSKLLFLGRNFVYRSLLIDGELTGELADGHYLLTVGFLPDGEELWTYGNCIESGSHIWKNRYRPLFFWLDIVDGFPILSKDPTNAIETGTCNVGIMNSKPASIYDLNGRRVTLPARRNSLGIIKNKLIFFK